MPVLIFGAGAVEADAAGIDPSGHLMLLGAMFALGGFSPPGRPPPRCASRWNRRSRLPGVNCYKLKPRRIGLSGRAPAQYIPRLIFPNDRSQAAECLPPPRSTGSGSPAPPAFYPLAGQLQTLFTRAGRRLRRAGPSDLLFVAPTDAQQGEGYRIIFIHVPAAWMAMFLYVVMAFWSAVGLVFNLRSASDDGGHRAHRGAVRAAVALDRCPLGQADVGAWWVGRAATSTLILFFLYLGFCPGSAIDDPRRADRAGAVIALVGVSNVPIIYFFGEMEEHIAPGRPGICGHDLRQWPAFDALGACRWMVMACWMYAAAAAMSRVRSIILERERHADWVKDAVAHVSVSFSRWAVRRLRVG